MLRDAQASALGSVLGDCSALNAVVTLEAVPDDFVLRIRQALGMVPVEEPALTEHANVPDEAAAPVGITD